ncbi:MAG TPA: hypothetical protein VHB54_20200 [Mucilaginibacter sp.]|nr:hypothetical protein [Bacteroidota bacterium]HVS90507.1 hypothetical protein [Mucilaginibacter sp.]HVW16164.1 hypothetical protein [Mucilaginibacter sp.]
MTYQQYYNKLIKDISDSQKHITEQNKILKGEKGYLDKEDMYSYMHLRTELNGLLIRSDKVFKLITAGAVNPNDEIDPVVLPDAETGD